MRNRGKLFLAAFAAAMLLSLAPGAGSARNFSISERNFAIIWDVRLEGSKTNFTWRDSTGNSVTCPLTLSGRFLEQRFAKTVGAKIGEITGGSLGTCVTGTATLLTETMPWEIKYGGFTGSLPTTITGININIIGFALGVAVEGIACLTPTEVERPFAAIINRITPSVAENVRADETRTIGLGGLCGIVSPESFQGTALLRREVPGGVIRIRLI
jgi:hypothetical protein